MNNDVLKYNIVKFVCFFLITSIYQQMADVISIWGIVPNITFLLLISSVIAEDKYNLFYPVTFGIIYDYLNGVVFGVYTLIFVIITFAVNELYHKNFKNVTFMEIAFVILGCFVISFFTVVFIALMDGNFLNMVLRISLVEFLYNSVVGVIILLLYKKIISVDMTGRRKRRKRSAWKV